VQLRRERRKGGAGRPRGKQPGAPGAAMRWAESDEVVEHRPAGACSGCGADLARAADLGVVRSYQQVEVPLPVERCAWLIADITGAEVSARFAHSCLARAAEMIADVGKLIKTLITAAYVAGFDETMLRCGPAGPGTVEHGRPGRHRRTACEGGVSRRVARLAPRPQKAAVCALEGNR